MKAINNLFRKGQHNIMKITSLAIGLALGLVLIAKIGFENSYDSSYDDSERIYMILETFPDQENNAEMELYPKTPGGIAMQMRSLCPEIETATRFTTIGEDSAFTLVDSKEKLKATYTVADSCFFDILSVKVLQGDPKEVLSMPLYAMVSESVAKKIGGDVIGRTLVLDGREDVVLTIGGVFKDILDNSVFNYLEILISMPTISYYTWDGSMNLIGNDRYWSLIKLREGASISTVQEKVDRFVEENFAELLEQSGIEFGFRFTRLDSWYRSDSTTRNMTLMLSLIAFALLFTAVMNYILLAVSSIIGRSKEIAVCKCYGAGQKDIRRTLLGEAALHTFLAVIIGILLLFVLRSPAEKILGTSLPALLFNGRVWILVAVCIIIAVVAGTVPGIIFSRIPVAAALRSYRESKRHWKLALLSLQFAAAAFLVILLLTISGQYRFMTTSDTGYEYENLAFASLAPVASSQQRSLILQEIEKLPEVEAVTFADGLPIEGASGDNVFLPGDSKELFNCADLYFVGKDYFDIMEIPVIQGNTFNENNNAAQEVMVSRKFTEFMQRTAGWDSDIVGKDVYVTSYSSPMTICGVYEDIKIGSVINPDERPSVITYNPEPTAGFALIKFHRISPEAITKAESVIAGLVPDKDLHVYSYKNEVESAYIGTKNFRNAVMAGEIITLAIVFIGLVGYTSDEVSRRRKEIAVRKINGAQLKDISNLLNTDVIRIAIPSVIAGAVASLFVAERWLEQFSQKTGLEWYIFVGGMLIVLALSMAVATYNVWRIADDNPVNSLKTE